MNELDEARRALAAGQPGSAVDHAWRAVRPAVLAQDDDLIRETMRLADEIATQSYGDAQQEAETLSAYCAACIITPRDTQPSPWSFKRLMAFRGSDSKVCPDCAEKIKVVARVCRYCGYRYPRPDM